MKSADDIRRMFKEAELGISPEGNERVFQDVVQAQQATTRSTPATPDSIWRITMRNPLSKFAAAAMIAVACVIGVMLWTGTGSSVALADVLARIEQIYAYTYKTSATTQNENMGDTTSEGTVLMCSDYGMVTEETSINHETNEQTEMQMYFLPGKKAAFVINLGSKEYFRQEVDDATLETIRVDNHDPREVVKRMLNCSYSDLGRSEVDGIRVQGFETTDPKYFGNDGRSLRVSLWVDVETWLPVRCETEMEISEGVHLSNVEYDYQWNIPVTAADFEPVIPEDFKAMEAMPKMPSFSEQGFIEALQLAVEFTGGYPRALTNDAMKELMDAMLEEITEGSSPAAVEYRQQIKSAGSKEAAIKAGQDRMMKLMALKMFNMILAGQNQEPVYRGDVVGPDDAGLPLMRWKLSGDEYRVIFGDLHTETVTADVMAELEAALPR
jgi:hypothetical protein